MSESRRKIAVVSRQCVACGSCEKVCPVKAISVFKGVCAHVLAEKCVGCGRCAKTCPASVITIINREGRLI